MRTLLLLSGSLLPVLSSVAYCWSIIRGQTRPHRMTRFLLMIITALMFSSLVASRDRSGVWLALVSFIQAIVIWMLSLKKGMGGRDRLDMACLGLCLIGLMCWVALGRAWIGLAAAIFADLVAMMPALYKTVRMPHTELFAFYALDVLAGFFIVLAGPYSLKAMIFPLYIAVINAVFACAIWLPKRRSL